MPVQYWASLGEIYRTQDSSDGVKIWFAGGWLSCSQDKRILDIVAKELTVDELPDHVDP